MQGRKTKSLILSQAHEEKSWDNFPNKLVLFSFQIEYIDALGITATNFTLHSIL